MDKHSLLFVALLILGTLDIAVLIFAAVFGRPRFDLRPYDPITNQQ